MKCVIFLFITIFLISINFSYEDPTDCSLKKVAFVRRHGQSNDRAEWMQFMRGVSPQYLNRELYDDDEGTPASYPDGVARGEENRVRYESLINANDCCGSKGFRKTVSVESSRTNKENQGAHAWMSGFTGVPFPAVYSAAKLVGDRKMFAIGNCPLFAETIRISNSPDYSWSENITGFQEAYDIILPKILSLTWTNPGNPNVTLPVSVVLQNFLGVNITDISALIFVGVFIRTAKNDRDNGNPIFGVSHDYITASEFEQIQIVQNVAFFGIFRGHGHEDWFDAAVSGLYTEWYYWFNDLVQDEEEQAIADENKEFVGTHVRAYFPHLQLGTAVAVNTGFLSEANPGVIGPHHQVAFDLYSCDDGIDRVSTSYNGEFYDGIVEGELYPTITQFNDWVEHFVEISTHNDNKYEQACGIFGSSE